MYSMVSYAEHEYIYQNIPLLWEEFHSNIFRVNIYPLNDMEEKKKNDPLKLSRI